MNIAELSVKRPIFVTCLVILLLTIGTMSLFRLPVDLFPNVTFPIVMVQTPYPGAGPEEVETLVSKVLEEEMSTLPGIKTLRSINIEGFSTVVAEFTLETDIKYAEQQIRDRVSSAKRKLPTDVKEATIRSIDPADQPILILALKANLSEAELHALANQQVKPKIEQINKVGMVQIIGGREREIQVQLDRDKLKRREISATQVTNRIAAAGQNIPAGKVDENKKETVFRTLGQFEKVEDIKKVVVSFLGNDVPVTVEDVGEVVDTVVDEKSRAFFNGEKGIFLMVYRQSGANTIAVADAVKNRIASINKGLKGVTKADAELLLVRDGSKEIRANVDDVNEAIIIGIILTVVVVYFFLGSGRSTLITGLAIPTSLLGAFFLMSQAGFSINVMSLLALSLAVGLLIDDAIVVRENIFRHGEMGKPPVQAALDGTKEVMLAVVAVTMAVISVFAPIGFLSGVVGQFFKEFGLTVCFAMAISLFDAMTMAPMMSAYFGGGSHGGREQEPKGILGKIWAKTARRAVHSFDRLQTSLENVYEKTLIKVLKRPIMVLLGALGVFFVSAYLIKFVPKTFLPPQDTGEFSVSLEMPPGTNLDAMTEVARQVDETLRANPEVSRSVLTVGGNTGESNKATFFVNLVPSKQRKVNTADFKDRTRGQLRKFAYANPIVKEVDMMGAGMRPFNVNIYGNDMEQIEKYATLLFERLKNHPGLQDVDLGYEPGKPEFQVVPDRERAQQLGVATTSLGSELRTQIEGSLPAVFREKGEEYDIRVRLREDQRNLKAAFNKTYVPNINNALIRLKDVAAPVETTGPATINRQDRARYIQIAADEAPKGPGTGAVIADIDQFMKEANLPEGVGYKLVGRAENFKELLVSMVIAAGLGTLFIYLVLSSLYESFITPLTILLVLPLAAIGAFLGLLVTQKSLDIFSMIGCVMLLGVATKNSILLVDYTKQLCDEGMDRSKAIIQAGKVRLRPILMTTIALIAGMLPIAIGLNEASKQRTSMGVAVIGGLISSTLLTLVVVPAAYSYIERFREWVGRLGKKYVLSEKIKSTT